MDHGYLVSVFLRYSVFMYGFDSLLAVTYLEKVVTRDQYILTQLVFIMNLKVICFILVQVSFMIPWVPIRIQIYYHLKQNCGLVSLLATNKILGTPQVVCTQEGVLFEMETQNPFAGQLYVKNEYENPKCRSNFKQVDRKSGALFKLNFNECSMRRQRMVSLSLYQTIGRINNITSSQSHGDTTSRLQNTFY